MNRVVECPFCSTQHYVKMSVKPGFKYENIISMECKRVGCEETFMIPLNYKKVYLARTFKDHTSRYKYPAHVKSFFAGILDFIDPNDFVTKELINNPERIVPLNKKLIDECDILVLYINQPTFGSLGEFHYAYNRGMPVYVINPNRVFTSEPWLKYLVDKICDDEDFFYQRLINNLVKEYNFK